MSYALRAFMFQTFFYQPILNLLIFLYNIIPGHDLGITIIVLTVVIKLALYPLSKKSIESQKSLQDLQPKIEEIKKKYKDKKEEMGKAMMDLYKNNKVNPLSSCFPLLIQMPFLFAVFRVFRNGFENGSLDLVYGFIEKPEIVNMMSLGFIDLAKPQIIIAVLAGLAQFWQSKMMITKRPTVKSPGAKDEDIMSIMNKQMVYFMPLMTVFIGASFPGGLALYWLTTTLASGVQQFYLFKKKKEKEDNGVIEGEISK